MHLKRLEIHGFKTFASHTALEFRPGITAIIGPNGSGKSNINDAVRWVLGEQSYSALRSKRTEDVIFSGGGKRAPSGFAEVSLTIDNSDRLLPVPYGEVTVTRRATRAGENEYFINKSRVRLRDIQEAVGPLGGSYTIINQGLVDAALTLRPEERRRLFEDAAEIGTFVSRKNEAESKLRETANNMSRSADVLAELEPRIRSLKRQASLARSYRELSEELRGLLLRHYTHTWHAARRQLEEAEQTENTLAAELERRRSAQASATAELHAARDTLKTLRERLGALHTESSGLHAQAEIVQRNLAVGAERLAALARREEEAERARRELQLRAEELERERAAIVARLVEAEARRAAAYAEQQQHEAAIQARGHERRAAGQQLAVVQRDEATATAALAESARRATQLAERRAGIDAERASHAQALDQAERSVEHERNTLHTAEARLAEAQAGRASAQAAEEEIRSRIEQIRAERAKIEEALAASRRRAADLDARLESLTRLQRSYAGTFAGVKAAMQWAESERRNGFALVSSLLRTPAHLETAIEVALGSRLQNIVVEDWQDAEDAIAALKKNGAGRATFLPLDTIRGQGSGARGQGPDPRAPAADPSSGVLGVAAQLIQYDDHYRDVVWNLLGRTLLVEELATARRVLREVQGGWTIVTLAGEQVNSGGAVTGGAQVKEAGVLRRERELRELPGQVDAARAQIEAHAGSRAVIEAAIQAAERELREAEAARRRAAQALEQGREAEGNARRTLERAETALDLQRRRVAQTDADLAAIEQQEQALADERASLEERAKFARAALATLRERDAADAEEEQIAQAQLNAVRAAVAGLEGELRAERALLQSHDTQVARLTQQRSEAETRTAGQASERIALQNQLAELEATHAAQLAQIDSLRALIDPAEAELDHMEQERTTLEQREAELTAALLEGESAYGRAGVDTQRARARLDTIWERAAADDIDVEILDRGQGSGVRDQEELTPDPRPLSPQEDLSDQIQTLRARVARLGAVNPLALEEYEEANQRYEFMTTQLADLQQAADSLRTLISELDAAMRLRFETTFASIAVEFEKCFVRLFGGGEAKIFLTNGDGAQLDGDGEYSSIDDMGIDITVRPPGKRQQNISLLSGGERALTASALLFAILAVNPSPFCILDEVDAALDEANVGRFRAMLADLGLQTQFILVTHNRGTIEVADTIYGVSMGDDGASRLISVRLEELGVG